MSDFLDTFKRRESSEGSIDDDDEYQTQFAREVIHHHSDEEDNKPRQTRSKPSQNQPQKQEERKQIVTNHKRREEEANRVAEQKKEQYLLEGEEKAYESDSGEQVEGQDKKDQKKEKPEKKDPTFVPKGSFYQHDTRGEDVEYTQKRASDKVLKWKHDKFERNFNGNNSNNYYNNNNRNNRDREYVKKDTYQSKKSEEVVYVPKGQAQQKTFEEDEQKGRPQYNKGQNKNYNYKPHYNKDRDRGYVKNQPAETYQYVKKNKPADEDKQPASNKDYYVEYIPKNKENK